MDTHTNINTNTRLDGGDKHMPIDTVGGRQSLRGWGGAGALKHAIPSSWMQRVIGCTGLVSTDTSTHRLRLIKMQRDMEP